MTNNMSYMGEISSDLWKKMGSDYQGVNIVTLTFPSYRFHMYIYINFVGEENNDERLDKIHI